jgi:hypothetical protein
VDVLGVTPTGGGKLSTFMGTSSFSKPWRRCHLLDEEENPFFHSQSFRLLNRAFTLRIFLLRIDEVGYLDTTEAIRHSGMHHMNFKLYGFITLFVSETAIVGTRRISIEDLPIIITKKISSNVL